MESSEILIPGGYYIKARCISEGWINQAPPITRETWDYLLREANHVDKKYNGYIVKRGELFRTNKEIIEALKWKVGFRFERYHESSMKRSMSALSSALMIERTPEPWGTRIKVVNYDKYQLPKNYERTHDRTHDRPMIGQPTDSEWTTNNKNEDNINKEEEKINRERENFIPPSINQVSELMKEYISKNPEYVIDLKKDPQIFVNFYQSKGWIVGQTIMEDWECSAENWIIRESKKEPFHNFKKNDPWEVANKNKVESLLEYEYEKKDGYDVAILKKK